MLLTASAVLVVLEYLVIQPLFAARHRGHGPMIRWALLSSAAYFVAPALVILIGFRRPLSEFGLSLKGFFRRIPLYFGLYLLMIPVIAFAASQEAFLRTYPFDRDAGNSLLDFLKWEAAYGLQFFALEFFFRGFLVLGLAHRFGVNSIFVMVVPYAMLHFHKPMLESTAAIFAGVILGYLAYRTRSIFGGVFLHFAVAVTMDAFALLRTQT